jgi:hypothetical protein
MNIQEIDESKEEVKEEKDQEDDSSLPNCDLCGYICFYIKLVHFAEAFRKERIGLDFYMNTRNNRKKHSDRTFLTLYP